MSICLVYDNIIEKPSLYLSTVNMDGQKLEMWLDAQGTRTRTTRNVRGCHENATQHSSDRIRFESSCLTKLATSDYSI